MSEIQAEVSMDDYVKARSAGELPAEKPAATTPPEKVETAPASATGTPESEEEKKAKGGGFQRRIDKLTKEKSTLEESLKEEREARQRLEARQAGRDPAELPKKETATEPGARPKPKSTDAKYKGETAFDDYIEDLAEWKTEQKLLERDAKQKDETVKQTQAQRDKTIEDSWGAKSTKAMEKIADWRDIVFDEDSEAKKLIAGSVIDAFILDPENEGPEVLYHLCKNPGEIERISALSPQKQIRELGKIEESLNAAKEEQKTSPDPKKVSLPAPIRPVQTGTSRSSVKPQDMSMEDYANWRKANR